MIESLTEMSDALQTCEREIFLYKDSKLQELVARLYVQLFVILKSWRRLYLSPRPLLISRLLNDPLDIEKPIAEMRRLSQAVLREADYQHRVEAQICRLSKE